jgi:hypothetical protein
MSTELRDELDIGKDAAIKLVRHLKDMGAANCMIPVTIDNDDFVVSVKPKEKPKMGMYDETPKLQIGKLTLCEAQDPSNGNLWIDDDEHDASEFPKEKVYEVLKAYYDKNF